ncbi:hypothetical protein BH10ACT3_BH10ACT3_24100 [soil metagenome]
MGRWRSGVGAAIATFVAVAVLSMATGACTQQSETQELGQDPSDVTIAGTPPTAPPTTAYDGRGLTSDANRLLAELQALQDEPDLCIVLVGDGLQPFLTGQVDTTNLVTSPSGLTQLLAAVNGLFSHVVTIAPPDIQPATATLADMWTRVAAVDTTAVDHDAQVDAITSDPAVTQAGQSVVTWVATNCDTSGLVAQTNP